MNPITYSNLVASKPVLAPKPVPIEGLENPLLIHVYTISDYAKVVAPRETAGVPDDDETNSRVQILRFLGGLNADVSDEAIANLDQIFTAFQLREIYRKAVTLNGQGPAALENAAKK